jgi:hypothetical protein
MKQNFVHVILPSLIEASPNNEPTLLEELEISTN